MAVAFLNEGATTWAAGSWSDSTGFAVGAELQMRQGSQTIQGATLDQSGLGAGGVLTFEVMPQWTGNIGSDTEPAKFQIGGAGSPFFRNAASGGTLWYAALGNANTCAHYIHSGAGTAKLVGGTFTKLEVNAGRVEVGTQASLASSTVNITGGTCIISEKTETITAVNVWGGTLVLARGFTNLNIYGGQVVYNSLYNAPGAVFVGPHGALDHRGGNIATFTFAGRVTLSRATRPTVMAGTAGTIVATTARIDGYSAGASVTWTTANITTIGEGVLGQGGPGVPL